MKAEAYRPIELVADLERAPSRVLGSLMTKRSLEVAPAAEVASWGMRALSALPGIEAQASRQSSLFRIGEGAEVITHTHIRGLRHTSNASIERFTREGAMRSSGKFGRGTYFGAGNLGGETVDLLNRAGNVEHIADVDGAFLLVDRRMVKEVASVLGKGLGHSESPIRSNIQNAPLIDLASQYMIGDVPISGVVVFMNGERSAAEVVMAPAATEAVSITSRAAL